MVSTPRVEAAVLTATVGVAIAIRLDLLVSTDFPLNDGALFLVFVEAIARVFPHLPATVDYNGLTIPFAYPPLAFWLAAAGSRLGIAPLEIVRAAPILMNIGYVLLFALLLLRTGHSRLAAALAVLIFGVTFRSYQWLVMGGGLARGLGGLFLLLTLLALLPPGLWRGDRWCRPRLAAGGLFIGCTLLSHLEWGLLATASALLCLALAQRRPAPWLTGAVALGAIAAVVVAPWFVSVVHVHGLAPFQAAAKTGSWRAVALLDAVRMLLRNSAQLLPFVLAGAVFAARSHQVFWVLFTLAAALLIPRSGETPLVLGVSVLAAIGLHGSAAMAARWRSPAGRAAAIVLMVAGVGLTALRLGNTFRRDEHFAPLPPETRSAMAWVAGQHPGSRFLIVRESPWYYDGTSEWFPLLARAQNGSTAQGREWLTDDAFERTHVALEALGASKTCAELFTALAAFPAPEFVWTEGVDLRARAVLQDINQRKTLPDRASALWRYVQGESSPDPRRGSAGALHGPGTAAGCFDVGGWRQVHGNTRVRIFQAPGTGR